MIKAIFFDLDGVLTTDKTGSVSCAKYIAPKINIGFQDLFISKKDFDSATDVGEISDLDVWTNACKQFGKTLNPKWLREAYLSTPIDEKMVEYAKWLKKKFKVGIITDNSVERVQALIRKHSWTDIFDPIVVSSAVKSTKRDTKIFEIATQMAKVNSNECLFIDNSQRNIDSANKAGLTGIFFDDEKRDFTKLFNAVDALANKIN